jgi:hypothetical protein
MFFVVFFTTKKGGDCSPPICGFLLILDCQNSDKTAFMPA